METIESFWELLTNSEKLIAYGGISLLLLVVFAETGLFFGFFLPGDYLLFTAGLLCGTDMLDVSIYSLTILVIVAAVAGDFTGYITGKYFGYKLFEKKESVFFRKEYLSKTETFFNKIGRAHV